MVGTEPVILKKFTNSLMERVREAGFSRRAFQPTRNTEEGFPSFSLKVGDSKLYFSIRCRLTGDGRVFDGAYATYVRRHPSPSYGKQQFGNVNYLTNPLQFEKILEYFDEWLAKEVKPYLEDVAEEDENRRLPDLWDETIEESIPSIIDYFDEPFSNEEQDRIASSLNDFLKHVEDQNLLVEKQLNVLRQEVSKLTSASLNLGKKEWLRFALATLITFGVSAGLSPEMRSKVINLGGEAIRWVFPPQPPFLIP